MIRNNVHVFYLIAMQDMVSYHKIITTFAEFYRYVKNYQWLEIELMDKYVKKVEKMFSGNGQRQYYHLLPSGVRHGLDEEWWSGCRSHIKNWHNGKLDGECITYHYYRPDLPCDRIKMIQTFKNGILEGMFKEYAENGVTLLTSGNYKNHKKEGEWRIYDKEGKINYIENFRKGRKHGYWAQFYKDGSEWLEGVYQDGFKHGKWIQWVYEQHPRRIHTIEEYDEDILISKKEITPFNVNDSNVNDSNINDSN